MLLISFRLRLPAIAMVLALLLTSFWLNLFVTGDRAASFFLPQFRAWELLLGALLATLATRPTHPGLNNLAAMTGLMLLVTAVYAIDQQSRFPGWWALLPTLGATLLIFTGPYTAINRGLGNKALVLVGKISFPLYLWHWPLLTFARIMEQDEPAPVIRLGAVAASILLAWLSYRLVETRLRYHPGRFTPVWLIAGLFTLGLAGLVIFTQAGVPPRTAEFNQIAAVFQWQEPGPEHPNHCDLAAAYPGKCLHDSKPPRTAILGDSHSTNTFFALAHHYRESGDGVIRLGKGGCPPLKGAEVSDSGNRDQCLAMTDRHIEWVVNNPAIETVFLSSMGPPYLNERLGRYSMTYPADPSLTTNAGIFSAGLDASVKALTAAGKDVVLVVDWPGLGFKPQSCVDTRPLRLTKFEPRICATPRQRHQNRSREYRTIVMDVWRNNAGIWLWDTPEAFCNQRQCMGINNGKILYRDPGHLSMAGSHYLGERLNLQPSGR